MHQKLNTTKNYTEIKNKNKLEVHNSKSQVYSLRCLTYRVA